MSKVTAGTSGTISLGNNLAANTPKTTYAYNKDVKAYMLDVEGNLSATTIDSLALDANDHVWFKLDDDCVHRYAKSARPAKLSSGSA